MVSPAYSDLSMSAAPEAPPPRSTKKLLANLLVTIFMMVTFFLYI